MFCKDFLRVYIGPLPIHSVKVSDASERAQRKVIEKGSM